MHHLLMAIMGIVLMSGLSFSAISYIPVDAIMAKNFADDGRKGFEEIYKGVVLYIQNNPDATHTDGSSVIDFVSPAYVFIPYAPGKGAWRVRAGTYPGIAPNGYADYYICLEPSSAYIGHRLRAMQRLRQRLGEGAVMGDTCGATLSTPSGSYLTLWVAGVHHAPYVAPVEPVEPEEPVDP